MFFLHTYLAKQATTHKKLSPALPECNARKGISIYYEVAIESELIATTFQAPAEV